MNLEELKDIWTSHAGNISETQYLNHIEIQNLLRHRSKGAVHKINRNILFELLASLMLCVGIVYWLYNRKLSVSLWEIWLFTGMFVGTGIFYFFKYKTLNKNKIQADNLLESLEAITRSLGIYMRIYLYSVVFLVPTLAFCGGYYGLYLRRLSMGTDEALLSFNGWLGFGTGMMVYAIVAILLTNWYYRKLYGTHYKELKACLVELKEL